MANLETIMKTDPEIALAMASEFIRQRDTIELIASENFVSPAVMEAMGSWLTNKYAEGYPSKRYYGGCGYVDIVEEMARTRACKLFSAEHANVQPHSGSQANMAVYFSLLNQGDTVLGMNLYHGGHLTHGSPVNISGRYFNFIPYGVSEKDERIDYDNLEMLAKKHYPKMIVAGASSYSREIDFRRIGEIAKKVGAIFMVDMAHIAGIVAAGLHVNPVLYADVVTTTTHKTLRGPRGGMILCKEQYARKIDNGVFPCVQGGPLMHIIAAKAICLKEAMSQEFVDYQRRTLSNAKALASSLADMGLRIVSGGTDNHLMLVDMGNIGLTGAEAEELLGLAKITVNKNTIPFDTKSPSVTSGIRLGTPAVTTRGFTEDDMREIAKMIVTVLRNGKSVTEEVKERAEKMCWSKHFVI